LRKSAATRVEAFEEDEKEEEGDEPAEEARERRRVREQAAQERGACVSEHGGRGPERREQQRVQCGAEAAVERGLPEGDERTLRLAERDGAEQRPLQRAEEVGEQQVEAVEHEQRGGEARVRHGDVEGRGRSVFAKSRTDLHKCQASLGICQVSKNAKPICKTVGEVFCEFWQKSRMQKHYAKLLEVSVSR